MYNLTEEFEKRYAPILRQVEELKNQLAALTNDNSFELGLRQLRAKAERVDGEILSLDAEGKFAQADEKKKEKQGFLSQIHTLRSERNQEIDTLQKKIDSLLGEKKGIADEVLEEGFASIQLEFWVRLEEAINFIDLAWKGIEDFQRFTQATAWGVGTHNLKLSSSGPRRELFLRLSRWVHMPSSG